MTWPRVGVAAGVGSAVRWGAGRRRSVGWRRVVAAVGLAVLAACGGGDGAGGNGGDDGGAGSGEAAVMPEVVDADLAGVEVLLLGDSLSMQAEPEIRAVADGHGYSVRVEAVSGHTPCDGLGALGAALAGEAPDVVVLAYAGNSWLYSPCLGGPTQSLDESVDRYRRVLGGMIDDVEASGAVVGLVGGPVWPANALAEPVHEAIRDLAEERGVGFVDGGRWVTPDRRWSEMVPCVDEDELGCEEGRVRVHLRDGTEEHDVHFDCDAPGWSVASNEPCPVYSAGGHRWARAIDDLVVELAGG